MENNRRKEKLKEWQELARRSPEEIREQAERILQKTLNESFNKDTVSDASALVKQKELVASWNQRFDSINHQSCKVETYLSRHPEQCVELNGKWIKPMLAGLVSDKRLPFVYEVLSVLMQATEVSGGWTEDNMVFKILGVPVSFLIFESREKRVFHSDVYEDEGHGGYRCRSRTFIDNKKLDLAWNGNLVMMMPSGKRINLKFSENEPRKDAESIGKELFQHLWSYALTKMLLFAEEKKRREAQRKRDILHNLEVTRLELLHQMMDNYENAQKLRSLAELMKKKKEYPRNLIQQSHEEANRLDPMLSRSQRTVDFFHLRDKPKDHPITWNDVCNLQKSAMSDLDKLLVITQEETLAKRIRQFAQMAMKRKVCNEKWLKWALRKADWYDPMVRCEDDIFGLRQLGEETIPQQVVIFQWKDEKSGYF